ncbi:MAG: hypothetical protein Q8J78_09260 [Moraxellaceae bacterium]|nr:hypothetical protein [Moraxellaceae bacterium]
MDNKKPSSSELREQRLNELVDSCQNHMLANLIGPFGLTPAMFNDKDGGSVTTNHNFEQGVVATEDDKVRHDGWVKSKQDYDRSAYDKELPGKRKAMFQDPAPIKSVATGGELTRDGQTHLDHMISAHTIETDAKNHLHMTQQERVRMANQDANLRPMESNINQSIGDSDKMEWANRERKKDPGKTNAESFGIDKELLNRHFNEAMLQVKQDQMLAQIEKQGVELATTSADAAGRNALRHAIGVLMHEGITAFIAEIRSLLAKKSLDNLIDEIVEAFKRVIDRVSRKFEHAFEAGTSGGIQGIISNILTFLINNLVTTSAKVVTIIREGLKGIWKAVKMLLDPPPNMPAAEVARNVTKIIAGVITTSLGMMLEESVKGGLIAIAPFLAPLIDIVAPVITGILTGVGTAVTIYTIDRFFDWLSSTGTELLEACEGQLEANRQNIEYMTQWLTSQQQNSNHYQSLISGNQLIAWTFEEANEAHAETVDSLKRQSDSADLFHRETEKILTDLAKEEDDLLGMLDAYEKGDKP